MTGTADQSRSPDTNQLIRAIKTSCVVLAAIILLSVISTLAFWWFGKPVTQFWIQNWGNIASVLGVVISVVGFVLTAILAKDALTAAQAAEIAAREARNSVFNFDSITELAVAITTLEHIKTLHRELAWKKLPDQYSKTRGVLFSLQGPGARLTDDQKAVVGAVFLMLKEIEEKIESHLQKGADGNPPRCAGFLTILKEQVDQLSALHAELRAIQGAKDGSC